MTFEISRFLPMIGRIYFMAVLPFFGAAAAPWLFGNFESTEVPAFLLWSFTVLIFTGAAFFGAQTLSGSRYIVANLAAVLTLVAAASLIMLFAQKTAGLFAASALLLFLHWLNLMWMHRTALWKQLPEEWIKQHNRFVWVVLACHMLVLFNQLEVIRRAA